MLVWATEKVLETAGAALRGFSSAIVACEKAVRKNNSPNSQKGEFLRVSWRYDVMCPAGSHVTHQEDFAGAIIK